MTFEDEVRDALHREAERNEVDVDAGWRGVGDRRAPGRRATVVLAAAAVLGVLAVGGLLLVLQQDGPSTVVTDEPASTTTTAAVTSTTGTDTTSTGSGVVRPDGDAPMPSEAVAVADDGRLLVLDTTSGQPLRELAAAAPFDAPSDGEGPPPNTIDDVDVDPRTGAVWYSECCEPAGGNLFQVSLGGSAPAALRSGGYHPSIEPDGDAVLASSGQGLLSNADEVEPISFADLLPDAIGNVQHPVRLDDELVAFTLVGQEQQDLGIFREQDGGESAERFTPPTGQSWERPTPWVGPSGAAAVLVAEQAPTPCCEPIEPTQAGSARAVVVDPDDGSVVDTPFAYDGTVIDQTLATVGEPVSCCSPWLLVTYADGRLQGRNLVTGEVVPIAEGYRAAAW